MPACSLIAASGSVAWGANAANPRSVASVPSRSLVWASLLIFTTASASAGMCSATSA